MYTCLILNDLSNLMLRWDIAVIPVQTHPLAVVVPRWCIDMPSQLHSLLLYLVVP